MKIENMSLVPLTEVEMQELDGGGIPLLILMICCGVGDRFSVNLT